MFEGPIGLHVNQIGLVFVVHPVQDAVVLIVDSHGSRGVESTMDRCAATEARSQRIAGRWERERAGARAAAYRAAIFNQ